jgi:ribose transport system substrate-binding protein
MIGCDAIDDTLEVIKDGKVEATIAEPPFFLGKAILNTAFDYLEGQSVEANVVLDNSLVTKDNVDTLVTKE